MPRKNELSPTICGLYKNNITRNILPSTKYQTRAQKIPFGMES